MLIAATHPFISSLHHIAGFLIVLIALMVLWGITVALGSVFSRLQLASTLDQLPQVTDTSDIDEEEVAAIAAIVVTLMGRRSRIVSIRSSTAKDWSREGRREHFASHKIR